ncbi:hypothetical protein HDV00_011228 [Rhizophlyctis rosea]|nr:hypothetical protein HDV00_011228 [Rhizophlyctis rosea]
MLPFAKNRTLLGTATEALQNEQLAGAEGSTHDAGLCLYIPKPVRTNKPRDFFVGYTITFALIVALFNETTTLPTPDALLEISKNLPDISMQASVRHYLENGGLMEYALKAILEESEKGCDLLGDGSFERRSAGELEALPMCRNDYDYRLVRNKLLKGSRVDPFVPYGYAD